MALRDVLPLSLLLLTACTDRSTDFDGTVELFFRPEVRGSYLACGEDYVYGAYTLRATDFRFFVHDVRLVTSTGAEHPLVISDDGQFQGQGLALLDFEDGSYDCIGGTPALNKTVRGTIDVDALGPATYTGVRFRIGVPLELVQFGVDPEPPLDEPTLRAQGGQIFLTARGSFLSSSPALSNVRDTGIYLLGGASRPNIPEISLDGFDLESSTIVIDWGTLLDALPLDTCTDPNLPCTCLSLPGQPLCEVILPRLGLDPTTGASTGMQTVFRIE